MHIFGVWVQNLGEIFNVPFEISHDILNPYTARYTFYEVLKFHELGYFRVMTSQVSVRRDPDRRHRIPLSMCQQCGNCQVVMIMHEL